VRAPFIRLGALALAAMVAGSCGGETSGGSSGAPRNPAALVEGKPYRPRIDPADFVSVIDNPYLPLRPGTRWVYQGISEGERERTVVSVTNQTRDILGVTATVVRDQVFVAGELAEDTFDWFAQDRSGNVWYFGEETAEYEEGEVVTRKGSWEAGVDGAQPGIVMLGDPRVGAMYRQEYYEGQAEDLGRVIALDESVSVPYDSFSDVLVTEDWTSLEPKVLENKFYARGVGPVLERKVKGGEEVLRLVALRQPSGG
jgi:hypothetical protein